MTPTALKFNETLPHPNDEGNMFLQFRERGFVVAHNLFEPDSVDAYRAQIEAAVVPGPQPWIPLVLPDDSPLKMAPAYSKKLRHFLRGCFSQAALGVTPSLLSAGFGIRPQEKSQALAHDWHKDCDHRAQTCAAGYQPPSVVHVVAYFEDMTPDHGPTYVIPRSHRDGSLSPHAGSAEEPFLPRKGDVVLWDQRTWHRGSGRTAAGLRIFGIWAFYAIPFVKPIPMPPAQKQAWKDAATDDEKMLFGGGYLREET